MKSDLGMSHSVSISMIDVIINSNERTFNKCEQKRVVSDVVVIESTKVIEWVHLV